jgi:beta-phosphoglucomutase family hydrolase
VLGLPSGIIAGLFDLDGVLTGTARVHDAAWKQMFDDFLRRWSHQSGRPYQAFTDADYNTTVDGRPRADGVRTFLASRGITLPDGQPDDPPERQTIYGLGNRKNEILLRMIREHGVDVYPSSMRYLEAAKAAGLRRAVVTASANGAEVIRAAGMEPLVEIRVDGIVAAQRNLRGKPEPDTFLAAAADLGVTPAQACVFEDAVAGVQAGHDGGFGYVVGVDRVGHADDLLRHGASTVVKDLAELLG